MSSGSRAGEWRSDVEADVVIAGAGFAGLATALAAAERGLEPLVLEKLPNPGGLSITSGGGVLVPLDRDGALECVRAACGERTPAAVVEAFVDGMAEVEGWVRALARETGMPFEIETEVGDVGYDLPGRGSIGFLEVKSLKHFEGFPWARGLRGGGRLLKLLLEVAERRGIRILTQTPVERLVQGPGGEVVGVRAGRQGKPLTVAARRAGRQGKPLTVAARRAGRQGKPLTVAARRAGRQGKPLTVAARRAVVLACGGFEWSQELKQQYFQADEILPVAGRGNTGDGIRMAQAAGAALWHMWHYHGSYGFRPPGHDRAIRHRFAGSRKEGAAVPWIIVDQGGRRYMNELHPAPNDTNARPMELFDPDRLCYLRIPSYAVFDEEGRGLGPLGFPIRSSEDDPDYEWSEDNLEEVRQGWIRTAPSLGALAEQLGIDAAVLEATVSEWNRCVKAADDPVHRRPASTMRPIAKPPYYAAPVWPLVSNTQGGPAHDERWRVLDPFGDPIPGLYCAGELGSIFGRLYLLGGNLAECFVSARVATADIASRGRIIPRQPALI